MLRSGGLCLAPPPGDSSLSRVSPRIRALQDRLLDSLPADGAWECLSPAQREAIISLHRARITRNFDERNSPPLNKRYLRKLGKGINFHGRSRSYEDKLESETDDSGIRVQSGPATTNSSNSQEEDSSDPGVKKAFGGRFAKSPNAEKPFKTLQEVCGKRKGVTNGVGNVNKIISKQLTKAAAHHQPSSKVTLDCRNLHHDRSRYRIDRNNPFQTDPSAEKSKLFEKSRKSPVAISRRNILQRYDVKKELRHRVSKGIAPPENFESFDNSGRRLPIPRADYDYEFDSSDLGPRSDSTPSPVDLKYPAEYQEERSRYSWTEGIVGSSNSTSQWHSFGSAFNAPYSAKVNPSFDYRKTIVQEPLNKYSSNWNTIILNNDVPIKRSRAHRDKYHMEAPTSKVNHDVLHESSGCDSGYKDESAFLPRERPSWKRYSRSKSLDRDFLDETSDDESDFEFRRRTDRLRRYSRNGNLDSQPRDFSMENRRYLSKPTDNSFGKRSRSDWDLSVSKGTSMKHDFEDSDDRCFKSRSNILNKWKSEDGEIALGCRNSREDDFERLQWQRRSCDIDRDYLMTEAFQKNDFKKMEWHRRSLDGILDFEESQSSPRNGRKQFYGWEEPIVQTKGGGLYKKQTPLDEQFFLKRSKTPHYVEARHPPGDYTAGRNSDKNTSAMYPRVPCTNNGWVPFHDYAPHHRKDSKKKNSGGAFRGKLKIFRSLLSF